MGRNNADFDGVDLSHAIGDFTTRVFATHRGTGKVIGMMQFEHRPPSGEIKHLFVEPEARRNGIATSMLNYGKSLSAQNPDIPAPQHSSNRTESGHRFALATGAPKDATLVPASTLTDTPRWAGEKDVLLSPDEDYNAPTLPEKLGRYYQFAKVERLSNG